jgi:hypothetical protein
LTTPFSSTNKIDSNDIAEILLKVALSTITPSNLIIIGYGKLEGRNIKSAMTIRLYGYGNEHVI